MTASDGTLWRRWIERRDADSLAEIFSRHAGMVHATCRRVLGNAADAEDAAQDCFADLLRAGGSVWSSLAAWLHTIALRRALDLKKRERRRRERERAAAAAGAVPGPRGEREEVLTLLDEAIAGLPGKLRVPVVHRFLRGESHAAIAAELGVSEATVRHRIGKGIEDLRKCLARRGVRAAPAFLAAVLGDLAAGAPASLTARLGKLALEAGTLRAAGTAPAGAAAARALAWIAPAKFALAGAALLAAGATAWVASREKAPDRELSRRATLPAPPAADGARGGREASDARVPGTDAPETVGPARSGEAAAWRFHCTDREGRPVAEAEVHVVAVAPGGEGDGLRVIAADSASTDASGLAVFAAPDVPAGDRPLVSAYAVLPGRLAGFADEEPAPVSAPLAVSMTESRPVAGVVDLPAGFDPRRVTIRIRSLEIPGNPTRPGAPWSRRLTPGKPGVEEAWRPLFARQADASGRFAFADIPAAAHVELNAAAERLGRVETTVPAPRPADAVRLEMFLEGIIAGTLLHEESGAPAAGVGLLAEGAGHAAFEASTDAAGRFTFRGLADDFYIIRLPWDVDLGDWTLAARPLVRAAPGVVTGGIDLRLERGALVTGTVADAATAKPLRARVSAAGKQGTATFFTAAHAPTDDEGRYALRLPRGEFVLNAAPELPGYPHACRTSRSVAIAAGDTRKEGVDFLLEAEVVEAAAALPVQMGFGHARGRIVDPEGNPRPEVHVSSSPAFEPARGHVEEHESRETRLGLLRDHAKVAISDAEGRYEVAVPAGAPFLITAGGGRFGLARARAFLVAPGETHEVEDLVVGSGTSSIAGVVLDPAGNPLAGATIITRSRSKVTHGMQADLPRSNREGRFRVDHLMDGEILEVNVNKHGYFSRVWYGVLPDADGLRFVLHPDMDPAAPPEPSPDLDPGTLIGRAAPAWEVAEWLREPPPPARPDRGDGRETLLVLVPLRAKWEDLGPDLKAIEDLSRRTGAIPVAILASCEHASAARRAMAEHGLGLAIGIDAYRPARGHDTSVTRLRYGHRLRARVFRIDAAGIVRAHARKIEEAESLFRS